MEKILLDTDMGSDIDDAVCLAHLLARPDCELLGITTVHGDVLKRAELASALVCAAGQRVPIYPGSRWPFYNSPLPPVEVRQHDAVSAWPHETVFPQMEWLEFMRHTIRDNPGEVTLLAIGPMTNVGLLLSFDPELVTLLKRIVLMCGAFADRFRLEWNALCDPYATAMVYRAVAGVLPPKTPCCAHYSVGLDVTGQCKLSAADVRRCFRHPLLRPVLDFAGIWFEQAKAKTITFHDPLAAVNIFHPDILSFRAGHVAVNLTDPARMGQTRLVEDGEKPHSIAETVDVPAFFRHYFAPFGVDESEYTPVSSPAH
jgi:inosine-uridine nucleoside N-ribohydrolase